MVRRATSRLVPLAAAVLFMSTGEDALAINAKSRTSPGLAVYDGKLHLVFAGHNNSNIWHAVYDPETRRWNSLGRIHDQNERRSWARSNQAPVAVGVEVSGLLLAVRRLDLVYTGHNNTLVWHTAKRPTTFLQPWDTPEAVAGSTSVVSPVGATLHRWGGTGAALTLGYERSSQIYYRVLETDLPPNRWSEEHRVPTGPAHLMGTGVTLLSSTHDGRRSEYPSLFVFYTRGEDILPGRHVYYTRPVRNRAGTDEWETPRPLGAEAPPVQEEPPLMVGEDAAGPKVINPGPIAAVDHPLGLLVAYAARDAANERNTRQIWMGLSPDGSSWAPAGFVQNIVPTNRNPALAVRNGTLYMAFLPVRGLFRGTAAMRARVDSELCVGTVNLVATGGPRFESIRHDLPTSYCMRE